MVQSIKNLNVTEEVLRKIEDFEDSIEWDRLEKSLRREFDELERANNDLGDDKTTEAVNSLRSQVDTVIRNKDVKMGREIKEVIISLFMHLTMLYQCKYLIQDANRDFDSINWKDRSRARQLINQGLSEINNQPTVDSLRPIAVAIIELMPDNQKPDILKKK